MGYDPDITKPSYAVIGLSGAITNERVLTGTTNKITITDGGAGGNVTFNTGSLVVHTNQANTYTSGTQNFTSVTTNLGSTTIAGHLIGSLAATYDLGGSANWIRDIYLSTSGTQYTKITTNPTGANRTFTIAGGGDSNSVIPDTGAASNFLTAISSAGVISKAQPTIADLSDATNVARRNAANTFSSGTQDFTSVTISTGSVTLGGTITPGTANTYDIGTANVGIRNIYLNGTSNFTHKIDGTTPTADRTFTLPNADSNSVIPGSASTNQVISGISSGGVISFKTISGASGLGSSDDGTNIIIYDNKPEAPTGRLTLLSLVAAPSSDQTAKTTVYYTPDQGNTLSIYNGSVWLKQSFSEQSITVPSTTNTNYDVFATYLTTTTFTLSASAWSSDTNRATVLAKQDGLWVANGTEGKKSLYLGSFRTTSVSGQTKDSAASRYLYNAYNKRLRTLLAFDTTDSWTYSSSTLREFNNSSTEGVSRVGILMGLVEDAVNVNVIGRAQGSASGRTSFVSIGVDSSTAIVSGVLYVTNASSGGTIPLIHIATYFGLIPSGYHTIRAIEASPSNSNTVTWYGDNGAPTNNTQTGLNGMVLI